MTQDKATLAQELLDNLQISQTLAKDILNLLKDENKAIRTMETQTLLKVTGQKESLLAKIHYVDRRVKEIIEEMVTTKHNEEVQEQQMDQKHAEPTRKLAEVALLLPEEQAAMILQYQKNLKKYRQEIHTRNLINKRFTSDTLLCINDAISLFTDQPEKSNIYGSKGVTRYAHQKPAMISREV